MVIIQRFLSGRSMVFNAAQLNVDFESNGDCQKLMPILYQQTIRLKFMLMNQLFRPPNDPARGKR